MARFDYMDVISELIELCHDIQEDILQQLTYYRASVYKNETCHIIDAKLYQLNFIISLFANDEAMDLFHDFEVSRKSGNVLIAPGECLLTLRISNLFSGLSHFLEDMIKHDGHSDDDRQTCIKIRKNRKKIVAACKQGSRKKHFFETL